MQKFVVLCAILTLKTSLWADPNIQKAEFTGQGRVKSSPDFITLDLTVTSQCYEMPLEAQSATDKVVKKIYEYLQTLRTQNDSHFKILVSGGFTSAFSKWSQNRELCQNTFQKVTTITLKLAAAPAFDKTFTAIQAHALKHFAETYGQQNLETPLTFVHINTPTPSVTPDHQTELDRKAINLAVINAKDKFKAATQSCQKQPWKIHQIIEENSSYIPAPRHFHLAKVATAEAVNDSSLQAAPVNFDDIITEKSLRVTFEFAGAMCYSP